ncbi:hypothetical protein BH10ACT1_BH10ACT1_43180 [soil metagenome]
MDISPLILGLGSALGLLGLVVLLLGGVAISVTDVSGHDLTGRPANGTLRAAPSSRPLTEVLG